MGIPATRSWEVPKGTDEDMKKINQPDGILLPSVNDTWEAMPIDPWAEEIPQHTYKYHRQAKTENPRCQDNPTVTDRSHINGQR